MANITMDLDDFICLMEHFTRRWRRGDAMTLRNAARIKSGRPIVPGAGGVYPSGYDPNLVPIFAGDPAGALVANVKAAIQAAT